MMLERFIKRVEREAIRVCAATIEHLDAVPYFIQPYRLPEVSSLEKPLLPASIMHASDIQEMLLDAGEVSA